MQHKQTVIDIRNLSYSYVNEETSNRVSVLHDVSFSVSEGEFVSIVGPSGCGKSTILKLIAKLLDNNHRNIGIDRSKMSFVFQDFALFPWLNVRENIGFGLKMKSLDKKSLDIVVNEKILEVGLSGAEHKYPHELSGGMKQRVGIARALAMSPSILLMDEPFSSLDMLTAEKLRIDLLNIWTKYKMTVVMVTHLIDEAVEMSDRVIVFGPRPTIVKKVCEISLPRPRDKRSKEYFDLCDLISKEIL
ncbi:MAG: ABC transporter ATP-binding protein [Candidatus Taylorbacteria bacterium]